MKIFSFAILMLLVSACNSDRAIKERIDEQKDLTVLHSQQLFQQYTAYLTSEGKEKERAGISLLHQLKSLDSLDYMNNPTGIWTSYYFDSTGLGLTEVTFQSAHYGAGWVVHFDPLLNEMNHDLRILVLDEMYKRD